MQHKIPQQAFCVLELILQWEGQFNSQRLMQLLHLSRQSVNKLLGDYKALHPGDFYYDSHKKVYFADKKFKAKYGQCRFEHYLALAHKPMYPTKMPTAFYIDSGLKEPKAAIVRPIVLAIQKKQRLDIAYISVSSPEYDERIISPHSVVFDGRRWHVRAWCEKNQDFRDFVLTRMRKVFSIEGHAEKKRRDDVAWNTKLHFYIEPEPRLSPQQQKVIALDYAMRKNSTGRYQRRHTVRIALLIYCLQQLRIDIKRENPAAQQIILSPESYARIAPYLP